MHHVDDIEMALLAVAYLSADERRLMGLLDSAGLTLSEAKDAIEARAPGFFAHVFEYLLSHELWAKEFAAKQRLSPEALTAAARSFGVGGLMDG